MKKITPERKRSLRREEVHVRKIWEQQTAVLCQVLSGLPGIDSMAGDLARILVDLSLKCDLDSPESSLAELHSLVLQAWRDTAGSNHEKLTVICNRVVEFVEARGREVTENERARFRELMAKSLVPDAAAGEGR